MSQLSLCERWLEGALFLSLDRTAPLFEDLWVPVDDRAGFQNKLREFLEGLLVQETYNSLDRAALGYRVLEWFYNSPQPELFSSWMSNIFVVEGPDRPGETQWFPLSFRIPRKFENERGLSEKTVRQITAVASFQRDKNEQLASKLGLLKSRNSANGMRALLRSSIRHRTVWLHKRP
jgi:hypothetical protein